MPHAAVAFDVSQSADVLRHLASEGAFDRIIALQQRGNPRDLFFVEVAGLALHVDAGLVAQLASHLFAYPVQVLERKENLLVIRNIDTEQTRHSLISSLRQSVTGYRNHGGQKT
jgi:hypothetical protein